MGLPRSNGEPYRMAPTRLAQGLGVHPATLTNRLDRLQLAGLITREHAPEDRRSLLVGLTPQGAATWAAVIDDQREAEATLLAPLAKKELGHLAALLRVVALAVEEDGPPSCRTSTEPPAPPRSRTLRRVPPPRRRSAGRHDDPQSVHR